VPSDGARLVRSLRLHCCIPQQDLARAIGKKKGWLAKRELGIAHMSVTTAHDLLLAIITMYKAETVEKNRAKSTILQDSDKGSQPQVAEKPAGQQNVVTTDDTRRVPA
jgi:hypothetical protein